MVNCPVATEFLPCSLLRCCQPADRNGPRFRLNAHATVVREWRSFPRLLSGEGIRGT